MRGLGRDPRRNEGSIGGRRDHVSVHVTIEIQNRAAAKLLRALTVVVHWTAWDIVGPRQVVVRDGFEIARFIVARVAASLARGLVEWGCEVNVWTGEDHLRRFRRLFG